MTSLEELGKKAYQKQILGDLTGAISIYDTAIKKYPRDPRLLNNRCCCYIGLKDYKKALEDAELMIKNFPKHAKSYFRKGEVLAYLKHFLEAEECFRRVLSVDPDCDEAKGKLLDVQAAHLCIRGYKRQDALKALRITMGEHSLIANVEDAAKILKFGNLKLYEYDEDIYYSDEEIRPTPAPNYEVKTAYDPLMDPANPFMSNTLWVGNVTEGVTEKILKDLFSKYGKILSVHVYLDNYCAFVNYADSSMPGKAMKDLQGKELNGKNILLRYPDSAANKANKRSKAT